MFFWANNLIVNINHRSFYFFLTEKQILICKQEIKESKEELQRAKVVRKNKQGLSIIIA